MNEKVLMKNELKMSEKDILLLMGRQISESFFSAKNHSVHSQNDARAHQMNLHLKDSGRKKVFKIHALHSLIIEMFTFFWKG